MTNYSGIDEIACDGKNKTHIGLLSTLCVNGSFNELHCMPPDEKRPWRIALGVWTLIVIAVGIFGNVFTLLAIPYAARRQRYLSSLTVAK
jgi:heme/copper-type cytochrome/quinol oxidase subunit 2